MKIKSPNYQTAANFGTADNPALIQIANPNGPNPTVARTVTPPAFIDNDTRPVALRVLDQNWRDAVRQGINLNHPDSLNPDGP
jgi:hypothetical protein